MANSPLARHTTRIASAVLQAAPSSHGLKPGRRSLNNPGYPYSEREKEIKMLNPFGIEIPLGKVLAPILPLPW